MINRYYDPTTGQFLSVDPDVAETGQPYAYAGGDPVNGSDPSGLCVSLFNVVCVGGGPVTSTLSLRFNPGAGANATVNVGRGASFGLSDTIANWISPGASCTVAQNGLDQGIGSAATIVASLGAGAEAADGLGNLGPFDDAGSIGGGSPALDEANQEMTVQDYASTYMKGSAARQIPGEFMNMSVKDALASGNTTVRKLLTGLRFQKG